MIVDLASGAGGTIEASWALRGRRCDLGFESCVIEGRCASRGSGATSWASLPAT